MDIALILGVIFTSLCFVLTLWTIRRLRIHQTLKKCGVPGPKPDFFAGNMYHLKKKPNPSDIIGEWLQKYGDVFGYYLGEDLYVVIKDLEMLKRIFFKDFNIFPNKPKFLMETDPFPKMLVGLRDKRWKEVRNIVTPAFSSAKIKLMTEVVSKKVNLTVDLIRDKAKNNEIFDIHTMMQALTLDVIAACALAMKKSIQENPKDDLLQAVKDTFIYQFNPVEEISTLFPFLSKILHSFDDMFIFKRSLNTIGNHLKCVIKERRKNPNLRSHDILQSLLDNCDADSKGSKTKLTEDEAIAAACNVLLAGYNTTSNSLGFTFYLLAKHPKIQNRLYEEIQQAKDSTFSTLQSLTYLDQVFSESLRLYPPITGFISRTCNKDYKIGSYTIPNGANVLAPVWNIHRDPNLWQDPSKFDPDRFSPINKGSIPNMAYFPFGAGPRNCAGERFALLEAKMAIFKIVKNFELKTCVKTEDSVTAVCHVYTLFPGNGVWLKAVPR
ncbi:cytochrome P450 3A6 [Parasteatoda tepidariorum]|uniref:cytochrome P450 3A6 n=1 Tax=Parasteatoda tepidariorum TaxID=114398 RepID=UPI00077FE2FD|nr:cytochrome P450 3A6 [Parasteatoda tepidariorum]